MKVTQKRVRQIIKEETSRVERKLRKILKEGYTVPEFETYMDMEVFLDELEPEEEVDQAVIDPESNEVMIPAGESMELQDWYEDSQWFVEPEEKGPITDMSDPDYDWDEHDRLEREEEEEVERQREEEEVKYEATKEKVMRDAADGGEDWAMDTMHDATNSPSMWQNTGDYNRYESPADYVRGFGQDAAGDIASGYTEWADDEDVAELWATLSDKDPYNTSWWQDSGRPSKTLFKEIVADAVYGGIERGVQKYIEKYGEWVGKEDPAQTTIAASYKSDKELLRNIMQETLVRKYSINEAIGGSPAAGPDKGTQWIDVVMNALAAGDTDRATQSILSSFMMDDTWPQEEDALEDQLAALPPGASKEEVEAVADQWLNDYRAGKFQPGADQYEEQWKTGADKARARAEKNKPAWDTWRAKQNESALSGPDPVEWAEANGLQTDYDNDGQLIIYVDDEFAQAHDLPDSSGWDVQRTYDDSGWVIYTGGGTEMGSEFEEIPSGGLDDLDDIGIDFRGY